MRLEPACLLRRNQMAVVKRKPFGKAVFGLGEHRFERFGDRAITKFVRREHPAEKARKAWRIVIHDALEIEGFVT